MKPWDDETDMQKMEECVRSIQTDGLLWGACKFLNAKLLLKLSLILNVNKCNTC